MPTRERVTLSVFRKTYEMLLKEKLKMQNELGREIIWDEFFEQLMKER
ncbi:MAG: hypothetical protein QXG39_06495 [Candidatus Aenigmatarchaeota archaeon]